MLDPKSSPDVSVRHIIVSFKDKDGRFMDMTLTKKLLAVGLMRLRTQESLAVELIRMLNDIARAILVSEHEHTKIEPGAEQERAIQLYEAMKLLETERNIRLFFYERAPCLCFQHIHEWTKQVAPHDELVCCWCHMNLPRNTRIECAQCRKRSYCSSECRSRHWPMHQGECPQLQQFNPHQKGFRLMDFHEKSKLHK